MRMRESNKSTKQLGIMRTVFFEVSKTSFFTIFGEEEDRTIINNARINFEKLGGELHICQKT